MNISVLVPCFNTASYLGEALESALDQSATPPHTHYLHVLKVSLDRQRHTVASRPPE